MVPTVFGPDDARRAVDAAYFPPLGHRSIAFPIRPQLGRDVADFLASANDEVLLILQVETAACLEQLEDTLAVPGVDAVFVGPFDLSYDLGLFDKYGYPAGLASEELQLAKKRIVDCCEKAGVAAGAFATGAAGAKALQDDGYMFIATGTDVGMLGAAAQEDLDGLRRL